jgi:hypothetical protein
MAIACLVQDPDGLLLHISPPAAEDYAMVEDGFALASRDFAEEITALRALVAWLEDKMQAEVRTWVQAGQLSPAQATFAIRELVLARFVSPDGVHGDDNS